MILKFFENWPEIVKKYLTLLKVEEWLKKALEDDEMDEITDDFDDCSIEVISQD